MSERKQYIEEKKAQLARLAERLARHQGTVGLVSAGAQSSMDHQISGLMAQRHAINEAIEALESCREESWEEYKRGTEEMLSNFARSLDEVAPPGNE